MHARESVLPGITEKNQNNFRKHIMFFRLVDGPFFGAFCGYGWAALRLGRGGGTCAPVPFFWTFRKYFWAWLRIWFQTNTFNMCKNSMDKARKILKLEKSQALNESFYAKWRQGTQRRAVFEKWNWSFTKFHMKMLIKAEKNPEASRPRLNTSYPYEAYEYMTESLIPPKFTNSSTIQHNTKEEFKDT